MTDESDANYRVTANELRQFIERFERLEAEKKDIADQQKEVMSEAKSRGYDTKGDPQGDRTAQARQRRYRRRRGRAGNVQRGARACE